MDKREDLGDEIRRAVSAIFASLPDKGKPCRRSNGVEEWTVMAAVVAVTPSQVRPICVATGVKTLPEKTRTYSEGTMVHDSHAEILSIRLFNWYLLHECSVVESGTESWLVEKIGEHYKVRQGMKFAMYVTEPPCGDCSMSHVMNELEDKVPWPEGKRRKVEVLRGRGFIGRLGVVRTKPGRPDAPISLSKSCSDKLCLRQLVGLTSATTAALFPQNVFLSYLVMEGHKFDCDDAERCFRTRFIDKLPADAKAQPLQVLPCSVDKQFPFHKDSAKVTCPLSLLYVVPTKTLQVLNTGVKDGSVRKSKPPKPAGASMICNRHLYAMAAPLMATTATSYVEFKSSQAQRQRHKALAKAVLGDWVDTAPDDFELPAN